MASLFGKHRIKELAETVKTEEIQGFIELVKTWHHDYHHGSLKTDKETSREQAYNQDFLVKILGYKEKPAIPYSLEPKATTDRGQLPDAVLSYTDPDQDIKNIAAVVELKGASIDLDRPQRRDGNFSPVQQGFKYKTQYRNCPFVVVSNFFEFRLYRDNLLDYESWTLDDLVNPENDYQLFKTWYVLLQVNNFTAASGVSKTEGLLTDIRVEQEEIGKKFYKVYRDARLELLRDIYRNNPEVKKNIEFGIEKAQKIIDRVVFTCFAEDKGLLPENTLVRVIKAGESSAFGGSLWNTLKGFFEAIDVGSEKLDIPNGYNGGLFKHDSELNNLKISDGPLKTVLSLGTYNFEDDLSVTILGHIFEQSISDLEEIKNKVNESQDIDTIVQSRRKKDGIFYTPDYIVRYIVDNSLGTYLREHEEKFKDEFKLKGDITDVTYEKREQQVYEKYQQFLENVKVLDPACGSGAFLVYVFDYLMAENKRVASIRGTLFNNDQYIRSILKNNIFGVDLNEESVEITKLSLWLKSAEKGKKLTTLDENIKCGNSLIEDHSVSRNKAFDWSNEFSTIMSAGGFDVVVGNPPYISYYSKQSQSDSDTKEVLQYFINKFSFLKDKKKEGRYNTVMFFIERSMSLLRKSGKLGFIVDTNIHSNPYGDLREYILTNYSVKTIIDEISVFDGVASSQMIMVVDNEAAKKNEVFYDNFGVFKGKYYDQKLLMNNDFSFKEPKDLLTSNLLDKVGKNPLLVDLVGNKNIRTCITFTGKKESFVKEKKTSTMDYPLLEGSTGVPGPYCLIKYINYVTYDLSLRDRLNKEYKELSIKENKRSPKVIGLGDLDRFKSPKIFIRLSDSRVTATYTNEFVCADLSLYILTLPNLEEENTDFYLKYLLAIINSKLITYYFINKHYIKNLGTGTPQIRLKDLRTMPIPEISKDLQKVFVEKADSVLISTSELTSLDGDFRRILTSEYFLEKFPQKMNKWWSLEFNEFLQVMNVKLSLSQKDELLSFFKKYQEECVILDSKILELIDEIDSLVFDLYKLDSTEIQFVEKSLV